MPIKCEIDASRRLKTTSFEGHVTFREFVDYRESLTPESMGTYNISFVDLSRVTQCDFGFDAVMPHANRVAGRPERTEFREIILATTELGFGLARMYELLVGQDVDLEIFRDQTAARTALEKALRALT